MNDWPAFCEKLKRTNPKFGTYNVNGGDLRVDAQRKTFIALAFGRKKLSIWLCFEVPPWSGEAMERAYDWLAEKIHDPEGKGHLVKQPTSTGGKKRAVVRFEWPVDTPVLDEREAERWYDSHLDAFLAYYQSELFAREEPAPAQLNRDVRRSSAERTAQDVGRSSEAPPGMQQLEEKTLWPRQRLEELITAIRERGQVILAGPPGTGKTWVALAVSQYLTEARSEWSRIVQFHPSYGYEEFVEGLRPTARDGAIQFETVPGPLVKMALAARGVDGDHVLVVDEMNRANLPRVFGELLYLLEYRGEENSIDLQYSAEFYLPENLRLIGTMNTADRSIRSIDIALRRRFEIFECRPERKILESYYQSHENRVPGLFDGFERLNAKLEEALDRHHTIGHTFFMADAFTDARLRETWERQLQPLIEEYFFDQPDLAGEFTLGAFWPTVG